MAGDTLTIEFCVFLGKMNMRHAFGLILASFVAAIAIAGVWYFTGSPHASHATTVAARPPEPPPAVSKTPSRDDVQVTAALSDKPPAPPVPVQQKPACAN